MTSFHQLTLTAITGEDIDFQRYSGQICLIVNLASR